MSTPKLLTRDQFREATFERDGGCCVFCDNKEVTAHHIIERRLWPDGGYYVENGASVCDEHHIMCETTELSVEQVREACGIRRIVLPPHLYVDQVYDKWGNPIMPNGTRLRGELFYDESVQKILAKGGKLGDFTHYAKYPRTHHVPWSPGMNDDDRMMPNMKQFEGQRVIVTVKMDGENTSMYRDHIHARSVDSRNHPSRSWVKGFWASIAADIPEQWRICGENLYAQHSIVYENLESYFQGFSIWNERNFCLSWDETIEWFELFGITSVPLLYDGLYDEKLIQALWQDSDWDSVEGYIIRKADGFHYGEFREAIAKFVRQGHVQTNKHWMQGQEVKPNNLKSRRPAFR
ncbi:RNA ligase family protein [Methylobacillus sp. Pita2]|uniref:RNA ligase family protein n=1 Tax=Methylobacillus sp. Pita2 TaxID=3383245 RepID=UPI0038B52B5F